MVCSRLDKSVLHIFQADSQVGDPISDQEPTNNRWVEDDPHRGIQVVRVEARVASAPGMHGTLEPRNDEDQRDHRSKSKDVIHRPESGPLLLILQGPTKYKVCQVYQ